MLGRERFVQRRGESWIDRELLIFPYYFTGQNVSVAGVTGNYLGLVLAPCALDFPLSLGLFCQMTFCFAAPDKWEECGPCSAFSFRVFSIPFLSVPSPPPPPPLSARFVCCLGQWASLPGVLWHEQDSHVLGEGGTWWLLYVETGLVNHLGRFVQLHVLKNQTSGGDRQVCKSVCFDLWL